MKPATVLFLDHTAKLGGGEIALYHVLTNLDRESIQPIIVLGEEGPLADKLRAAGIETCVIPLAGHVANTRKDGLGAGSLLKLRAMFSVLAYAVSLSRFIKKRGIDLVHTNSLKADLIGGVAARLAGVPVVWHVRDRIEDDYLPAAVVKVFRLGCRVMPSFIIANSMATLKTVRLPDMVNRAGPGDLFPFISDRAAIVHEGTLRYELVPKAHRDTVVIGLVGRISRWKGQHIFLAAAAEVLKKFPQAKFQIVGSAMFGEEAYEREIRALAESLGIRGCVEFMGFRSDAQELIGQFDVLVHASVTGEPFGQVIIEAMVVGKPVVATRGGGVPEIVIEGVTGLLVPMGDAPAMANAICELLSDPARAEKMGNAGRERVLNHFTVDLAARRVGAVIGQVLGRKSAPAQQLLAHEKAQAAASIP